MNNGGKPKVLSGRLPLRNKRFTHEPRFNVCVHDVVYLPANVIQSGLLKTKKQPILRKRERKIKSSKQE